MSSLLFSFRKTKEELVKHHQERMMLLFKHGNDVDVQILSHQRLCNKKAAGERAKDKDQSNLIW